MPSIYIPGRSDSGAWPALQRLMVLEKEALHLPDMAREGGGIDHEIEISVQQIPLIWPAILSS